MKKEIKLPNKPTTKRDKHFYDKGSEQQARVFVSNYDNSDEMSIKAVRPIKRKAISKKEESYGHLEGQIIAKNSTYEYNLDIPSLREWNLEKKMPLVDKITWVLTAVNVAIFITLVIKNI